MIVAMYASVKLKEILKNLQIKMSHKKFKKNTFAIASNSLDLLGQNRDYNY